MSMKTMSMNTTNTIKTTIITERNIARRDGFTDTLRVTQAMLTAISAAETAKTRRDLSDAELIPVLRKLANGYRDASTQFAAGGQDQRAHEEENDARIVESFLPTMLDADATRTLVEQIVKDNDLTPPFSPKMNGVVMRELKSRTDVDAKLAVTFVRDAVEGNGDEA